MDYYDSEDWQQTRDMILEDWDGYCERCECLTESPHVHHVYGLDSDVFEILCPDCHAEHHGDDSIAEFKRNEYKNCRYCNQLIKFKKSKKGKYYPVNKDESFHNCQKRDRT